MIRDTEVGDMMMKYHSEKYTCTGCLCSRCIDVCNDDVDAEKSQPGNGSNIPVPDPSPSWSGHETRMPEIPIKKLHL